MTSPSAGSSDSSGCSASPGAPAAPAPPAPPAPPAAPRHETIYSTPSDRELVIVRTFDAPRALVWAAFTDPVHLPKWHTGPEGTTMPVCEIDLRPGGVWRFVWRNAQGRELTATGIYREVDPPRRIVSVTRHDGEEQTSTTTFADANGRTTVTVVMQLASAASRDQALKYAKFGTGTNHARLDRYLASAVDTAPTTHSTTPPPRADQ